MSNATKFLARRVNLTGDPRQTLQLSMKIREDSPSESDGKAPKGNHRSFSLLDVVFSRALALIDKGINKN